MVISKRLCKMDGCLENHLRLLHESLPVIMIDQQVVSAQPVLESNSYLSLTAQEGAVSFAPPFEGEDSFFSRADNSQSKTHK